MKFISIFILLLAFGLQAQQIDFKNGFKTDGTEWSGAGLGSFIDTTTGTTNSFVFKLGELFYFDANAAGAEDVSKHSAFGSVYAYFDNVGTASPTTDSLLYTVKVYPGVYTTANKGISSIAYGSAVTLETIAVVGDYLSKVNIHLGATHYKAFPPEVFKYEIAPSGSANCDDSTNVYVVFSKPAIHQIYKERK